MIAIVLSNPRHHAEMCLPVARQLVAAGERVRVVSLAELRGFVTPPSADSGVDIVPVVPFKVRSTPSLGAGLPSSGRGSWVRSAIQRALWFGVIWPRLRQLVRGCRAVLIPNDAAFPYDRIAAWLTRERIPFVLLQEGIRFPLPVETARSTYGLGGAHIVCAWGEGSRSHFLRIGVAAAQVRVTGNPRFDGLAPAAWKERGTALLARHGLATPPLVYLSNPIDDQGFCTTAEKLELFRAFLAAAAEPCRTRGCAVVVKLHPREDRAGFVAIAAAADVRVVVLGAEPLFEVLAAAAAAVVLASTVGLEALFFGVPIGCLRLPGHGYVFDYVSSGAAVPLEGGEVAAITELLDGAPARAVARAALVEHHLAVSGAAGANVAAVLLNVGGAKLVRRDVARERPGLG